MSQEKLNDLKLELKDLDAKIEELSKDFKLNTCDKINLYIINKYLEWKQYASRMWRNSSK
jgi:hypothetical protein